MAPADVAGRAPEESKRSHLLALVRAAYPHLVSDTAQVQTAAGQFNDVLLVNGALVFRFPRSAHGAAALAAECALLARLHGRLPLPTPNPMYQAHDPNTGAVQFMGYPLLPGQPLWNDDFRRITDESAHDHLAAQLAGFLEALHGLPLATLGQHPPMLDSVELWASMHHDMRAQLYPFMRPDACVAVTQDFAALLDDLRRAPPHPTLRHGDFGTGNILYDPQRVTITGIIDFAFCGIGDPAIDVAALSASYGDAFIERCGRFYPAMEHLLPRARLYQRTFALQQALYALRDGNTEDFEDGIAAYT